MNRLLLIIMLIQIVLCLICALLSTYWLRNYGQKHWYLSYEEDFSASLLSFYVYFSYFLLFNTMIPISLIVSLEFVKVFQSYFMMADEEMYVKSRDKYCKV